MPGRQLICCEKTGIRHVTVFVCSTDNLADRGVAHRGHRPPLRGARVVRDGTADFHVDCAVTLQACTASS
jgi:hypothetical protein